MGFPPVFPLDRQVSHLSICHRGFVCFALMDSSDMSAISGLGPSLICMPFKIIMCSLSFPKFSLFYRQLNKYLFCNTSLWFECDFYTSEDSFSVSTGYDVWSENNRRNHWKNLALVLDIELNDVICQYVWLTSFNEIKLGLLYAVGINS